jgi:hypothetical protein
VNRPERRAFSDLLDALGTPIRVEYNPTERWWTVYAASASGTYVLLAGSYTLRDALESATRWARLLTLNP